MDPKELRIVFLGTPGIAAYILDQLVLNGYNVCAVVTTPDKPAGRGQQLHQSEVKQTALKHSLPVLQPEKLKAPEFLEQLSSYRPDLMIVVAFRMLPVSVWSLPPMGTFNLHASLLPQYRGAAPINRAIMNGEKVTGITTFLLQQEIDTGNILFREEIPIGENETAGELHDRMMVQGASLVMKTVDAHASGSVKGKDQSEFIQPGEILHDAPKLFRENCRIDWNLKGEQIRNHIRGLNPFPSAWTELVRSDGSRIAMKIFASEFHKADHTLKTGSIRGEMEVAVSDGFLTIKELQAPGKKRMSAGDFLRGFKLQNDDHFD